MIVNSKELNKNNKKFFASKKMGQNFLINKKIQEKIVNFANIQKGDNILEIGPGMGAITGILLTNKIKLVAIELDKRLYEYLSIKFSSNNNFSLINNDALKLNWNTFLKDNNFKIVANLPYSISSSLILKIIHYKQIDLSIVMVQKEFAQRITAKVGTKKYNMFTILVSLFLDIKFLFDVSPQNFNPAPKVISSVVEIKRKTNPIISLDQFELVDKFLRICFLNKRKTLLNNLSQKYDHNKVLKVISNFDLSPTIRCEQLTPEQLIKIMWKLNNDE